MRLAVALLLFLLAALPARAEWYVGGYGGLAAPDGYKNVSGHSTTPDMSYSDIAAARGGGGGLKLGGYLPADWYAPYLGAEIEILYHRLALKNQSVASDRSVFDSATNRTLKVPVSPLTLSNNHLDLLTLAFNLLLRYPGDRFQPYAGAGVGLTYAMLSGGNLGSDQTLAAGANLLAGFRAFLSPAFSMFVQYKHQGLPLEFNSTPELTGRYVVDHYVLGAAWHF